MIWFLRLFSGHRKLENDFRELEQHGRDMSNVLKSRNDAISSRDNEIAALQGQLKALQAISDALSVKFFGRRIFEQLPATLNEANPEAGKPVGRGKPTARQLVQQTQIDLNKEYEEALQAVQRVATQSAQ